MVQLLYKLVYSSAINRVLRNLNKALSGITSFRLPPAGMIRFELKNGRTLDFYTNQTDHAGFLAFWEGLYNYEYLDLFDGLVAKCKGFVDIGSNAGLYSLVAVAREEDVKVIAFDPTMAASQYFQKNIAANNLGDKISYQRMAVSDSEGEVEFFNVHYPKYPDIPNLGGSSSFVVKPTAFDAYKVKSTSLDNFLANNSPEFVVDLVKIDAEGAEPMILAGMKETIAKHKPIIICEVLHDEVLEGLDSEFKKYGYGYYFHLPNGLKLVDSLNRKSEFDDVRNCFFVPEQKLPLLKNWIIE